MFIIYLGVWSTALHQNMLSIFKEYNFYIYVFQDFLQAGGLEHITPATNIIIKWIGKQA